MAHRTEAPGTRRWSLWRELPVLFVVALLLALLIKAFVVQSFRIPSGSMEDTLRIGDWVLVNKMVYHFRDVNRGDIVVFNGQGSWDPPAGANSPAGLAPRLYHDVLRWVGLETDGTDYIKRVIGLPGDHVMCCDSDGRITVNGVPLSEGSYLYPGSDPSVQQFKIVVPPRRVWVMGDHRADSADSRYHMQGPGDGTIPLKQVVGRAFVVFWPLSQLQTLSIPRTFKQSALHSGGMGRSAATPVAPLVGALGVVAPGLWLPRRFRRLPRRDGPGRACVVGRICEHKAVSMSRMPLHEVPGYGHRDRCCSCPGISSFRWMTSSCHASPRWRRHPSPVPSRRPRRRNGTGAAIRRTLRTRGMSR